MSVDITGTGYICHECGQRLPLLPKGQPTLKDTLEAHDCSAATIVSTELIAEFNGRGWPEGTKVRDTRRKPHQNISLETIKGHQSVRDYKER